MLNYELDISFNLILHFLIVMLYFIFLIFCVYKFSITLKNKECLDFSNSREKL